MTEDITTTDEFQAALTAAREGLDAKNKELLDKLAAAKKAAKPFEGIDPTEYAALKEAQELAEAEKAKAAGDFEAYKAKLDKKLSEKDSVIADLSKRNENTWREREALEAIAKHGGSVTLLRGIVSSALQVEADGDGYAVHATVDGEKLSPGAYVESLASNPDYAGAFDGTGVGGQGAKPASGSVGTGSVLDKMVAETGFEIL